MFWNKPLKIWEGMVENFLTPDYKICVISYVKLQPEVNYLLQITVHSRKKDRDKVILSYLFNTLSYFLNYSRRPGFSKKLTECPWSFLFTHNTELLPYLTKVEKQMN